MSSLSCSRDLSQVRTRSQDNNGINLLEARDEGGRPFHLKFRAFIQVIPQRDLQESIPVWVALFPRQYLPRRSLSTCHAHLEQVGVADDDE